MKKRVLAVAVPIAALPLFLTGCSAAGEPGGGVPVGTQTAIISLVNPPPEIRAAVDLTARECLSKAGFSLPQSLGATWAPYSSPTGVVGLFPSVADARQHGYSSTMDSGTDWVDAFRQTLSPARQVQFDDAFAPGGSPQVQVTLSDGMQASRNATGCNAEAQKAVYGSVKTGLELDMFVNDVLSASDNTKVRQTLDDALPKYRSCMQAKGIDVSGLNAPDIAKRTFGAYRAAGQAPSSQESAMAVVDATCQRDSGLVSKVNRVYFAAAATWMANHESEIAALEEDLTSAQARAKAILEDG